MKIKFKNGKTYELEDAGRDGILVFEDAIFEAPFDEDIVGDANVWEKCSLKKRLESWWEENAPDALKAKYDVSMLSVEEVFDQEEIDEFFSGSGKKKPESNQLPLFAKDWKARIKRLPDGKTSDHWWLRSLNPWARSQRCLVTPDGSLCGDFVDYGYGCVPACYPKGHLSSSLESAREDLKRRKGVAA